MKTIIQKYGPYLGTIVNGSVQGRPNGSVYVPKSNTVAISTSAVRFIGVSGDKQVQTTNLSFSPVPIKITAESQDPSNRLQTQIFTDAECTDMFASMNLPPGQFNTEKATFAWVLTGDTIPGSGEHGYFRVQLMTPNGDPVATSNVIDLTRP